MTQQGRITLFWSPKDGLGKTTLAVMVAQELALKGTTALIDLNRYVSALPFIERSVSPLGLKSAYDAPEQENCIPHFTRWRQLPLFYLSMSVYGKLDDLYRLSTQRLDQMIQQAREHFDYVVLIVPSNYIESGFVSGFASDARCCVLLMDEEISNWYRLKSYDVYLKEMGYRWPMLRLVVNQWRRQLDIKELTRLGMPHLSELMYFPWLEDMPIRRNQGQLQLPRLTLCKKEKMARACLEALVDFIVEGGEDHRSAAGGF